MKNAILLAILLSATLSAQAQVQTEEQCQATVRARAGMSINSSQAASLCKSNSIEVVNCAMTQIQGSHVTSNLDKAIKQCRNEWQTVEFKDDPTPAPKADTTKSDAKVTVPDDRSTFQEIK